MPSTLDDAASLLIQLEASDAQGLAELRALLASLAEQPESGLSPSLRERFAAAAAQLGRKRIAKAKTEQLLASLREAIEAEHREPYGSADAASSDERGATEKAGATPADPTADPILTIPDGTDIQLLHEFITESREYLDAAEAALLALEATPDDAESVNTIFRAFHTIKGTAGFLGLEVISEFAHRAESLLCRVRDREIRCVGGYAGLALRSVDALGDLLRRVLAVADGETATPVTGYTELAERLVNPERFGISELERRAAWNVRAQVAAEIAGPSVRESSPPAPAPSEQAEGGPAPSAAASSTTADERKPTSSDRMRESTLRVRTDRLDSLVEMVGELVIAQSMIAQDPVVAGSAHIELARKVQHASKIVRDLQDLSMGMRMVPLRAQFQKIARVVRDLATKAGKQVLFVAEGEETEIDRNLVDFLSDPLVHMVRNAVDHGIESPLAREALGKPRIGAVRVRAAHASGHVVVELTDDGRGLSRDKIVNKAIEKGIIASSDGMSEAEIFALIFAPGFSTVEKVTEVSGRGVGMDVVRRNVEAMRGRVEIASRAGAGTTFTIRLPLTLAITDGMLVRVGTERFIVPTSHIRLSFRPEPHALATYAGKGEMVMLRDEVLPLVRLHRVFEVTSAESDPSKALVMVVGAAGGGGAGSAALLVDELLGQHQVVAKALGDGLGAVPGVSGGAILGDGRVGLILDVNEVLALARGTKRAGRTVTADAFPHAIA